MSNAKILCIEDVAELREAIVEELEDAGYEALEAGDGKEGLNAILSHRPDLVVSDITMPNMSGLELVTELRNNHPQVDDMPFIFLTALADREDVMEGLRTGADDYLTKPVDFDMLLQKVETTIRRTRRMKEKAGREQARIVRQMAKSEAQAAKPASRDADRGSTDTVLVGKQSKALQQIAGTLQALGMKVNVFESGSDYLKRASVLEATLTLVWMETQDHRAPAIMNALNKRNGKYVLVVPVEMREVLLKPVLSQFDHVLTVPITRNVFLQNLKTWLSVKTLKLEDEGEAAFI